MKLQDVKLAIVGLGYVGLPLAVEFGKQRQITGYDINPRRVAQLQSGHDNTLEVEDDELTSARIHITAEESALTDANVYIVTTPTPIDKFKQPDLRPVLSATEAIARNLGTGDVVIYESTVYPGATEEECVPLLEQISGLQYNVDFFVGYSPERINPGDKEHRVHNIVKVTSGSTPETADFVDELYRTVVTVGTHRAPSIKVAEAAKVIENTQRDVNIALINELAILFNMLGIDTEDVLLAAGSKWNFLPFRPGLVGGHCIGVDPYYLTRKAQSVGYHPEMILAGRRINDSMAAYAAAQTAKAMAAKGKVLLGSRVLVLGLTFKENTPDLRNTKVVDMIRELEEYGLLVDVHDPLADPVEALELYGLTLQKSLEFGTYEAAVLMVGHKEYVAMSSSIRQLLSTPSGIIYDLKGVLDRDCVDIRV